jgi:hypothetical protein
MADGPKIIEFRSSDSGGGGSNGSGTSLVPVGSNGLTSQQQEQVKHFGELLDRQADEYARYYGQFFDEFINFFSDAANKARQAEEDIIDGEFSVGDGGSGGNDPPGDDPFSFMDDGRHMPDDVRKWLDELEQEYKTQAELLERSNQAYDELTEQADGLGTEMGAVASAAGTAGAALFALATVTFGFMRIVDEMVEAVGGFSAQVAQASANSRIQEIEDRIRLADEAGGDIATLEGIRSELASELRGSMRELIELVSPLLELIGKTLIDTANKIRLILEALSTISGYIEVAVEYLAEELASKAEWIPLVGPALRRFIEWMKSDNDVDSKTLNQRIDALFDPENIWDDDDDGAMDMPGGDPRSRNQLPNGRGRP